VLLVGVTGDCAEHHYYYWSLETVQSTPIMTGDWRQCRATRLCRAPLLLLITGDCAEHYYYYWGLETCAEHSANGEVSTYGIMTM
jgi:hypothetical protein